MTHGMVSATAVSKTKLSVPLQRRVVLLVISCHSRLACSFGSTPGGTPLALLAHGPPNTQRNSVTSVASSSAPAPPTRGAAEDCAAPAGTFGGDAFAGCRACAEPLAPLERAPPIPLLRLSWCPVEGMSSFAAGVNSHLLSPLCRHFPPPPPCCPRLRPGRCALPSGPAPGGYPASPRLMRSCQR